MTNKCSVRSVFNLTSLIVKGVILSSLTPRQSSYYPYHVTYKRTCMDFNVINGISLWCEMDPTHEPYRPHRAWYLGIWYEWSNDPTK